MMLDVTIAQTARAEYEERVQHNLLLARLDRKQPATAGAFNAVLLGLSNWLIDLGTGLKQRVEIQPRLS